MTNLEAAIQLLATHREARHWQDAEVADDIMVMFELDPEGVNAWADDNLPPVDPPVNVDAPHVSQDGELLNCTMGNWNNKPTDYTYQWMRDDTTAIGVGGSAYIIEPEDMGHTLTCVVRATNAIGTTEAPPSNGVVIAAPATATSAILGSETFTDDEIAGVIGDLAANGTAYLGFDIVVDGVQRQVRQQFGHVTSGADVCAAIDASLGAFATTTLPGTAAPWRFFVTSVTTGAASTIGYALPPTSLAEDDEADPMKKTSDIGYVLRLTQDSGAILAQGSDAVADAGDPAAASAAETPRRSRGSRRSSADEP